MTVIPDSIEPYIGWKSLRIGGNEVDGWVLLSPQQETLWPIGERFEASCTGPIHEPQKLRRYDWELSKGRPRDVNFYMPGNLSDDPNNTLGPGIYYVPPGVCNYPPPPDFLPPEGYYWEWVAHEEWEKEETLPIASSYCSCGIYCVAEPSGTIGYFRDQCVLAEIALWGTVTRGSYGARGQYAYPQRLLIPASLAKPGIEVAKTYQVPYEIIGEVEVREIFSAHAWSAHKQAVLKSEAANAAAFFLTLAAILSLATSACTFLGAGSWAFLPLGFMLFCGLIGTVAALDAHRHG